MRFICIYIIAAIFPCVLFAQSLYEDFSDGDFLHNPTWFGDTHAWQIVNNSDAGQGATASKSLRLSAPSGGGMYYLGSNIATWGQMQQWSFWMGRRSQALTASNAFYFWLFASDSNFNATNLNGYRLAIGDDQGEDEIRLEYIKNGIVDSVFLVSNSGIANGRTDFGLQLYVARSHTGHWSLYSSAFPVTNGTGIDALQTIDSSHCKIWLGSAHHQDTALFQAGFLGFGGQTTSSSAARNAIEIDQISFVAQNDSLSPLHVQQPAQSAINYLDAGTNRAVLTQFNLENDQHVVFNQLAYSLRGSYTDTNQYANLQLHYNTEPIFTNAVTIGQFNGRISLNELYSMEINQLLSAHLHHYFWISIDLAAFAFENDSLQLINLQAFWLHANATGNLSPSSLFFIRAAVPELSISSTNNQLVVDSIQLGADNQLLSQFAINSSTYAATLTSLSLAIDTLWESTAIDELQLWYGIQNSPQGYNEHLIASIQQPTGQLAIFDLIDFEVPYGQSHIFSIKASLACDGDTSVTYKLYPIDSNCIVSNGLVTGSTNDTLHKYSIPAKPLAVSGFNTLTKNQQLVCNWNLPANCYDFIVLLLSTDSFLQINPQGDASNYAANAIYGQGSAVGNAFVVYKGKGNTVPIVNLAIDSTYYITLYTLLGEQWSAPLQYVHTVNTSISVDFDSSSHWIQGDLAFGSYANHAYQQGNVYVQATNAIRNTATLQDSVAGALGNYAFRLQDNASMLRFVITKGGVSAFSFSVRRWDASPAPVYQISYSLDQGLNYVPLAFINNDSLDNSSNWKMFNYQINSPNDSIWIEISRIAGERIMVDEFSYSPFERQFTYWDGVQWSNGLPDSTKNAWILKNFEQLSNLTFHDLLINENVSFDLDSGVHTTIYNELHLLGKLLFEKATLQLYQSPYGEGSLHGGTMASLKINGNADDYTLNFDSSNSFISNHLKQLNIRSDSNSKVTISKPLYVQKLHIESLSAIHTNELLTLKAADDEVAEIMGGTQNQIIGPIKYEIKVPHWSPQHNGYRFLSHCLSNPTRFNEIQGLPNGNGMLIRYLESINQAQGGYQAINNRNTFWSIGKSVGIWIDKPTVLTFNGKLQLDALDSIQLDFSGNSTGWNFLGNPFPGKLDWDEVVVNQSVANAVYTWKNDYLTSGMGSWGTYINGIAANGGSRYIAPGQGFALKALQNNPVPMINFPAIARKSVDNLTNQSRLLPSFLKIKLNKWENGKSLETILRFESSATNQFDLAWDGVYLSDGDVRTPDLYSLDVNNIQYTINSLPLTTDKHLIIPIGVESTGNNLLSLDFQFNNLEDIAVIEIEDLKNQQFRKLVNNTQLIFEGDTSFGPIRFRLHINRQPKTKPLSNQQFVAISADKPAFSIQPDSLHLQLPENWQRCVLYTLNGQKVWESNRKSYQENSFFISLISGIYLVYFESKNDFSTTKIFIP